MFGKRRHSIGIVVCILLFLVSVEQGYAQMGINQDGPLQKVESPYRLMRGLKGDFYKMTSTILVGYSQRFFFNGKEVVSKRFFASGNGQLDKIESFTEKKIWIEKNRF